MLFSSVREEAICLSEPLNSLTVDLTNLGLIPIELTLIESAGYHRGHFLMNESCKVKLRGFLVGERAHETRVRLGIRHDAFDALNNVVEAKEAPPAISLDIIEDEAGARVRRVAPDDSRRQERSMLLNVSQSDVVHVDERLGLTGD